MYALFFLFSGACDDWQHGAAADAEDDMVLDRMRFDERRSCSNFDLRLRVSEGEVRVFRETFVNDRLSVARNPAENKQRLLVEPGLVKRGTIAVTKVFMALGHPLDAFLCFLFHKGRPRP